MINGIIFDLDGTLLNTLGDLADCCNKALEENGFKPCPVENYRQMVGNGIYKLIERCANISHNSAEMKKIHDSFSKYYSQNYHVKTVPYDGINDMLKMLSDMKIKTSVLSNKPHEFTVKLVKEIFGENRFDAINGQKDGIPIKPAPDAVLAEIDEMGLTPKEVIYVGDSNVDIETAKNSGLKSIGCSWGFRGEQELKNSGADYIAHEPYDIIKIIKN